MQQDENHCGCTFWSVGTASGHEHRQAAIRRCHRAALLHDLPLLQSCWLLQILLFMERRALRQRRCPRRRRHCCCRLLLPEQIVWRACVPIWRKRAALLLRPPRSPFCSR